MAVSTIIILMLINGFCLTEAMGAKMSGVVHRTGALLPGITGALGFLFLVEQRRSQFFTGGTHQYLRDGAAADCVLHFFLHDQQQGIDGRCAAQGRQARGAESRDGAGFRWPLPSARRWSIWSKIQWIGVGVVGAFILLVWFGHGYRKLNQKLDRIESKLSDK